jgi:hypothetical protein
MVAAAAPDAHRRELAVRSRGSHSVLDAGMKHELEPIDMAGVAE